MKKIYYRLKFVPRSPLRIGNGMHELSDSDLMLDGRGLPFIPGTSLAGIIRHRAGSICSDKETLKRLFGNIEKAGEGVEETTNTSSAIIIGDAVIRVRDAGEEKDVFISNREGVALGEWETAKKGAKFDFQISETDREFYSIVEWTGDEKQETEEISKIIEPILKSYIATGLSAGARTSRGYGKFDLHVTKKDFAFPDKLSEWIEFKPYDANAFEEGIELKGTLLEKDCTIKIGFKMKSTFSVRVRTARTELMDDGTVPDSVPMTNFKGKPIIPGTAWAGVFRHHMHHLLRDIGVYENSTEMKSLDRVFGMSDVKGEVFKSLLNFSESVINIDDEKKQRLSITRTAVDRFTASPRNAALYTNMVYCGGNGELLIRYDYESLTRQQRELIAACICDMHIGLLTVGGQSSVGSGIMEVESVVVNGVDKTTDMTASIESGASLDWLEVAKNG